MKRLLAPEVVQTSSMDCGPACLKCLLDGYGRHASYGRLREACQTGLDGTSIDTMEAVANQLGLEAEQVMLPVEHILLRESKSLPAIVVVKLPNGLTHFVVVWSVHRRVVQVMDPSAGRRWTTTAEFANEVYSHAMAVGAADWREFAASEDFRRPLTARLRRIGIRQPDIQRLWEHAVADQRWHALGALDAGTRLATSVAGAGGLRGSHETLRFLERVCANPELIPARYWTLRAAGQGESGTEQVLLRGAVLVRVRGKRADRASAGLTPELQAVINEQPVAPTRELLRFLRQSGRAAATIVLFALLAGAGAVVFEGLLFRGLFDIGQTFGLAGERLAAMAAILLFSLWLLLLDLPMFVTVARFGRQIENRLRVAFLEKIPKLGDRYFQSRLSSDMAERSHLSHRIRHTPELARQLLRSVFELCATAAGIVWLDPWAMPLVLLSVAAALVPTFSTQSALAERDLRVRSHAAGLTRFYLDAMLGLVAIRAHGAEGSVRREHEKLLGEWAHAALRLQKTVVSVEAVQLVSMFGLVAALVLFHPLHGANFGKILLVVYWALNMPALGQEIAALARQYPYYRNLTMRLLEPLGAPEEFISAPDDGMMAPISAPPSIEFHSVSVEASGHKILEAIDLHIKSGSEVAIVGPSGAGKSSLVGILLGWLKPSAGEVLIDGAPLNCDRLRCATAWVDPAVQLWNRSLLSNLLYGSESNAASARSVVDAALLRGVLESLPEGFETKLGEGGALVSGGEGQRVRFGRAMLRTGVRLVILDEPFRGLDREKRRELLARAREFWRGCTLLCITHDVAETQSFDRVVVVEQGRISEEGRPDELRVMPESRYAQLLEAEKRTRAALWGASFWRRIRIHSGRIVEEHKPAEDKRPESEVA